MPGRITELSETQIIADLLHDLRRQMRATAAAQQLLWEWDTYTITGSGDTTHTLTYLPYGINVAALNGLALTEGVDYTTNYTTGVVTLTATLTAGDVLHVRYVTNGDLIAFSGPLDTGAITDNFNRTNSASTINPASDGGSWTVSGGTTAGVTSNQGYIVSGTGLVIRDVGSLSTDVTITNTRPLTTSFSYIQFCYDDGTVSGLNDGYALQFDSSTLMRVVDERTATVRATVAGVTAWTGGSTTIRVTYIHATNLVTVYQNGTSIWSGVVSGAVTTGSWVGFSSLTSSIGETWDNFSAMSS